MPLVNPRTPRRGSAGRFSWDSFKSRLAHHRKTPETAEVSGVFHVLSPELALFLALLAGVGRYALNKAFHPGRAGLLHLLRHVSVDIQSKSSGVVTQILLHRLDVVPALEGNDGIAMPIGYNKDKSENPCGAMVLTVCPYSFSIKKALKMGAKRGGEKEPFHIKDKFWTI